MRTVAITVKGKVQGVFFRQNAKEKAISLNLKGTIENLPEGDVYILASGEDASIEDFIGWCNQGPTRAEVTEIIVEELPVNTEFRDFYIIR